MPRDPTIRTPLLRLPGMRRADAPGLGRTNPEVRRNVSRLRRLLTPKISRRRQPTEALMMMITEECHPEERHPEECHPEEVQAFATRRPADEGSTALLTAEARPDCRVHFTNEAAPSKLAWARSPSAERIRDFLTLTSKSTTLGWVAHQAERRRVPQANSTALISFFTCSNCFRV